MFSSCIENSNTPPGDCGASNLVDQTSVRSSNGDIRISGARNLTEYEGSATQCLFALDVFIFPGGFSSAHNLQRIDVSPFR